MNFLFVKTDSRARIFLMLIWFFFFVINLSVVLYLYYNQWIEKDNFHAAFKQLNAVYAPYLGAVLIFFFSNIRKRKKVKSNGVGAAFAIALLCSLLWNGAILFFILPLLFQVGTIEDSIENVQFIGGVLSWLVAGAIGYYFANPTLIK